MATTMMGNPDPIVPIESLERVGTNEGNDGMLSDDEVPVSRTKKRATRGLSDSSSEEEGDIASKTGSFQKNSEKRKESLMSLSDSDGENHNKRKSRIQINRDTSDDEESSNVVNEKKQEYFPKRDRKKKLREKFKKMLSPGESGPNKFKENSIENDSSEDSDSEMASPKLEQKVKEISSHISLSICDPDDSDDGENGNEVDIRQIKMKSKIKANKPKPMRMSAKEAMENMQKIKSESNRMLREKEVSLPYHRPKALSLKDIMSRRRPAVTSDGKTLPIKMNEEQLRHYAMQLEQRQKEMMELCKSESEEEDEVKEANVEDSSNNEIQLVVTNQVDAEIVPVQQINEKELEQNMTENNDISFDQVVNENMENIDICKDSSDTNATDIENMPCPSNKDSNDLIDDNDMDVDASNTSHNVTETLQENNTEESQIMALHYDSEKPDSVPKETSITDEINKDIEEGTKNTTMDDEKLNDNIDEFSDNEINYDDIDALIENAEIFKDDNKQQTLAPKDITNTKPKLTGAPGMIISLDGDDTTVKPSGVELLKERFTYFAKLKKEEDMEKDREKKYKPGTQHIKLKQQLEEQIAEQRSLEWTKRLEEEKLLKSEQNAILGDDSIEEIDKIEKKLEEEKSEEESGTDDDDLVEDDVDMSDKPQKRNPMLEDEAEESEDNEVSDDEVEKNNENDSEKVDEKIEENDNLDESGSEDESSSESEDEMEESKPKKGRILKAFEDSDEEDNGVDGDGKVNEDKVDTNIEIINEQKESQDDDLQLAQANKSISEDLFPSQESSCTVVNLNKNSEELTSGELGTFSILNTLNNQETKANEDLDKLSIICETQPNTDVNFDDIAGMCSGSFSQNCIPVQEDKSQLSPSQEIGDDVAALCTGQFYDNPLVSQAIPYQVNGHEVQDTVSLNEKDVPLTSSLLPVEHKEKSKENEILKSILDELDDPEYDKQKQNKLFPSSKEEPVKKKFVIDSDDDTNDAPLTEETSVKKKHKKRKLEARALQISDDEEEDEAGSEDESDLEDEAMEKVYEYDSEENEVEVQDKPQKKKKRVGDFFENEAELTSEDEWAGSGDEDEAGLDRMEREEGDDEVFHQGKLQRELGQIHMREVLDQDKREVRLIQELLFEDADLGDGHRQRKFRWRNNDGEEETGTIVDEFGDTQEDEFESEEQWRKQRHEREMFLRKMQENGNEEDVNTSINRTTIIKANLTSRTMSNLIAEAEQKPPEKENVVVPEKKITKDIPSPKKAFAIFKQNYHGSLLTRGRGALARLAALATPLAGDDDAPKGVASARGNFVFAALGDDEPKPKKRKAEPSVHTPKLIKKMKTEDSKKTSLFDRLRD